MKDDNGKVTFVRVPVVAGGEAGKDKPTDARSGSDDSAGQPTNESETLPDEDEDKIPTEFTDEEYLIASPVVLGFAFAEKMWLEFTVSGVKEIQWNETAYESLVLEPKTKDIVKVIGFLPLMSSNDSSANRSCRLSSSRTSTMLLRASTT